ncbi:hypothetical protein Tco_0444146, partial [Tanacetum coccineum]
MENASPKDTDKSFPSAGQANPSPTEGEKNTTQATKMLIIKGKEVMSSKDTKKEETESDSKDDHANPVDSTVESFKQKKL